MDRISVIAPPGKIVPRQNCSGMIDDKTPANVESSRYYRTLIAEGSLLKYTAPAPAQVAKSKREEKQ